MATMRANVFRGVGDFGIEEVPRPKAGIGEAVVRVNAANQATLGGEHLDPHYLFG